MKDAVTEWVETSNVENVWEKERHFLKFIALKSVHFNLGCWIKDAVTEFGWNIRPTQC